MDPTVSINERVDMVAIYYAKGEFIMLTKPVRMRWRNQEITFAELALRHDTVQGKRMLHVFHLSDSINNYRVEFDAENLTWTLVSMIPGGNNNDIYE